MAYLQQILQLPYAHLWIPGLIFLVIVGGIFALLLRSSRTTHSAASAEVLDTGIALVTAMPLKPGPKEQRNSTRREGNTLDVHFADPEDKSNPEPAVVQDRSMGGLRLATRRQIAVGTILAIRPVHANAMVPWVDVEVRSCRVSEEIPGEFDVGCQFVKVPPYSIMLLFG